MKRFLLAILALTGLASVGLADTPVYTNTLVSEPALAYSKNYVLDLNLYRIDYLSMLAVYSTATIPAVTFTDGRASTASITVAFSSNTVAAAATDFLTVLSTSGWTDAKNVRILVNGIEYRSGDVWNKGASINATAVSIMSAINATSYGVTASTSNTNRVNVTCNSVGSFCNNYTLSVVGTSSITANAAKFSGGRDNGFLTINGVTLTQGTDWTADLGASSGTAKSISDAILANATLSTIILSTGASNGVVFATSTAAGLNAYTIYARPAASLTVPTSQRFTNGAASAVVTSGNEINVANHGLSTALPVLLTKSAGTYPGQLVNNTTYYAIPVDANNFQLATTSARAQAGTPVIGLSTQTALGGGSFTLTPIGFTGTPSFKWQSSNDSSNWVDVNVSSVTFSSPYTATSSMWDFGRTTNRFLQLTVTGPTTGGLNLVVTGYGTTRR